MEMEQEMRNLAEEVVRSRDGRRAATIELKEEVAKARREAKGMIEDLKASRNEAESRLREDLGQERTKLHNETEELLKEARFALKDITSSRKEAAHELRHKLEESKEEMHSEVKTMLKAHMDSRKEMLSALQRDLAQGRANRQKEVEGIREETQKLLSHFGDTLKEVGRVLREGFSEADAERKSSVQDMRQDVREMQEGFRKEREALKADLRGAAAAWRERFTAKTIEAPKAASPVEAAVDISSIEEAISEEKEEITEVGAEEESFAEDFKSKILAVVNDHPEGISLADIAERLGVAFVVLGRDSKALLDEGKLRREGKLYFPVFA